jgi:hypothetical protein
MFRGKYPREVWQLFSDIKNEVEVESTPLVRRVLLTLRDIPRRNGRGKEFEENGQST